MDLAETPSPPPDDDSDPESEPSSGSWLQILANYATLLVAVSAVVLSVWQGYEMRKHNRLSVLPNLDVQSRQLTLEKGDRVEYIGTLETVTKPTYFLKVGIENTGLGPAVFEKALLYRAGEDTTLEETQRDGEIVNIYSADSLIQRIRSQFPEMARYTGPLQQGTLMRAGDRKPFLEAKIPVASVPDTLDEYPPTRIREMVSEYSFVVCYCSVYGENCDRARIGAEPPDGACEY